MTTATTDAGPAARARRDAWLDCAFVAAVLLVVTVPYLGGLGFHSDDWAFLGSLRLSGASTFAGHVAALCSEELRMRPVQCLLIGGTYHFAGLDPLAYHVVNTGALILGALLLLLVLRELGVPRPLRIAVPLLYAMLPHYATDRFWIAAIQATASAPLFFLTVYAELRAVRAGRARVGWWALAAAARTACALAYEVFIPLLFLSPLLAWLHARRQGPAAGPRLRSVAGLLALGALTVVTLAPALAWKASVTNRLAGGEGTAAQLEWFWWMFKGAWRIAVVDLGVWLPRVVWRLGRYHPTPLAAPLALAGALLAGAYLARVGMRERRLEPRPRHAAWLLAAGAVLFAGGYAIFLATKNAMNTPSGIGNRVAIAAAVGVALGWAGVAWGLAALARSQRGRAAAFAVMIAGLFGAAVFVNVSLARFWADAYRAERAVLAEIRRLIPAHPGPITLLLDGVCPYVGPAIVFESNWDLAGALAVVYGPPMMRADVVTPYLTVGDTAVTTSIYHGDITAHYGYRDMVLVDVARGRRVPLADAAAARRHFAAFNPDRSGGCPPGAAGQGVAVF